VARKLLSMGMPIGQVSEVTGLSMEDLAVL
jgi:hypothetical protein